MRTQASPVLSLKRFANPWDVCRTAEHPTSATALKDTQVTVGGSESGTGKKATSCLGPCQEVLQKRRAGSYQKCLAKDTKGDCAEATGEANRLEGTV